MENDFWMFVALFGYRTKAQRTTVGLRVGPLYFRVPQVVLWVQGGLSRMEVDFQGDDGALDPTDVLTAWEYGVDLRGWPQGVAPSTLQWCQ